jgi:formylglycine-generating enzyme required for sulfatase activity
LTVEDKGSGSYAFAVKENEGDADRSATVVFGYTGKSVTVSVTQTAAQLTVSPTEIEVHADAESSHFGVKEEGGYGGVVAQTGTSWLRVTQDYKTASGWSMYKIDADANDGTGDRTATVTFTYAKKSATVTVTQKAVRLSNSGDLDNATDVLVSRNLTLSFNKKIVFGSSGTITLVGLNGGSNVAIDVTNHGGQLSIAGNVLTINPTNDLAGSGQYAVNISAGALRDTAGNAYAGISDTTTVNFTTQAVYIASQEPNMVQVGIPGVTYTVPIGRDETNTNIAGGFLIGTTEVTYQEWYDVRTWAESNGYTFQNKGREGHDGTIGAIPTEARFEPVTSVSWRDVVVWSNAKSEKEGLDPVYRGTGNVVLRDAHNGAVDTAEQSSLAHGYRLPTNHEWEMAARWLGATAPTSGTLGIERRSTTVDGVVYYWSPFNYASGANTTSLKEIADVAWYFYNSNYETQPTRNKRANVLGIYDLSGNAAEWTSDMRRRDVYWGGYQGLVRGGAAVHGSSAVMVFNVSVDSTIAVRSYTGFRIAKTQ